MTSSTTMRMALSALLVMMCSSPALAALGFSDNNQACRDRNTHCRSWRRDGYCKHAAYKQWMTDNCAKTCKACVVEVNDPEPMDGYELVPNHFMKLPAPSPYEIGGIDIPNGDLSKCTQHCNQNADCKMFNYHPKNKACYFKSATAEDAPLAWQKHSVMHAYIKVQPEQKAIDGSWGLWGAYGACSVTCGAGNKSRMRVCDSPAPEHGGKECTGEAKETADCNEGTCQDASKEPKCSTSGDCDDGLVCNNYNLCAEPKFANQINGTCATTFGCAKMHGGRVICYKEEGKDKLCKCEPGFHQSYEYGENFHACLNACHRPRTVTPFFTSVYNGYVSSDLDVGSKLDWVKSRKECDKQCMEDDNCIATHIYWKEAGSDPICSHIMRGNYPTPRGFIPSDSDYTVNALADLDVKPVYNAIFSMKGCNITKSD